MHVLDNAIVKLCKRKRYDDIRGNIFFFFIENLGTKDWYQIRILICKQQAVYT